MLRPPLAAGTGDRNRGIARPIAIRFIHTSVATYADSRATRMTWPSGLWYGST